MAYYLVIAKPKPDRLPNLLSNLQERSYLTMQPFGRSLTYSLENARLRDDGYAVWEEEDYCSPPLAQERAAALDEFLVIVYLTQGLAFCKMGSCFDSYSLFGWRLGFFPTAF